MSVFLTTDGQSAECGIAPPYTIQSVGNIRIVTGIVPTTDLVALLNSMPATSVMDIQAAQMLGANFVFGPKDELNAFRESQLVRNASLLRARAEMPGASDEILNWLAFGERGSSSNLMFKVMLDLPHASGANHPHDIWDFRRCRLLLDAVPTIAHRLPMLADVSPEWKAIIENWQVICAEMDAENPDWRTHREHNMPMSNLKVFQLLDQFQKTSVILHDDSETEIDKAV